MCSLVREQNQLRGIGDVCEQDLSHPISAHAAFCANSRMKEKEQLWLELVSCTLLSRQSTMALFHANLHTMMASYFVLGVSTEPFFFFFL